MIQQFTPNYPSEAEYESALAEIQGREAVAVHVRRGDFLNAQNDPNPNHYLLGEQYYHNALKYVTLHTKHADIDEMMLMKNCKHIIAANSTFSWWASWLNEHKDALHICPAKRYGNLHMIPENWIKIGVE